MVYIYSFDGATKLASYGYDAWGNVVSVTDTSTTGIASINPIRYRGYYYDTDLDLYYLQSRYYNPKIGRFLNADGYISTGQGVLGHNMFAYCGNNPVNYYDPTGHSWASFRTWVTTMWTKVVEPIKKWYDRITTVKDTSAALSGAPKEFYTHAENATNTMYNKTQEKNAPYNKQPLEPIKEEIDAYNYWGKSTEPYSEHLNSIVEGEFGTYIYDISRGRKWSALDDGEKKAIVGNMVLWDNATYDDLCGYHQFNMAYTYWDALY